MINNPKEPAPAIFASKELFSICTPHEVRSTSCYLPLMLILPSAPNGSIGAQKPVLSHQVIHSVLGHSEPFFCQLTCYFLVALSMKWANPYLFFYQRKNLIVFDARLWPWLLLRFAQGS